MLLFVILIMIIYGVYLDVMSLAYYYDYALSVCVCYYYVYYSDYVCSVS